MEKPNLYYKVMEKSEPLSPLLDFIFTMVFGFICIVAFFGTPFFINWLAS